MVEQPAILIADDEASLRAFLKEALEPLGRPIVEAADGVEAVERAKVQPLAVALVDIKMPRLDGLATITRLRAYRPNIICIIMTAFPAEQLTVNLLRADIQNCLTKPVDLDVLRRSVRDALSLAETPRASSAEIAALSPILLGVSAQATTLREAVARAAQESGPLLLLGEAGSRWGSVAKAVHDLSQRRTGPFVAYTVEASPAASGTVDLSTVAWADQFDLAGGGTLFIGHLERLPLAGQWALVQQMDHPAGDRPPAHLMAAREEVAGATPLLPELLQRFAPSVLLPPLRQRREDLPQLVEEMIRRCNRIFNKSVQQITVTALEALMNYAWPRNIEELEECVQHGVLLSRGSTLVAEALPEAIRAAKRELMLSLAGEPSGASAGVRLSEAVEQATAQIERQLILAALEATRWNRTQAAQRLGISRKSLHNKLKKYGLRGPGGREEDEEAAA